MLALRPAANEDGTASTRCHVRMARRSIEVYSLHTNRGRHAQSHCSPAFSSANERRGAHKHVPAQITYVNDSLPMRGSRLPSSKNRVTCRHASTMTVPSGTTPTRLAYARLTLWKGIWQQQGAESGQPLCEHVSSSYDERITWWTLTTAVQRMALPAQAS